MLLSEYLDKLDTKQDILASVSFMDLPWRRRSGVVYLKLVPNTLQGVPAEVHVNCIVAKDALHFLNIFRKFKDPATVKEFLAVLDGMAVGGEWGKEKYVSFHLGMYGLSFCHLKLMEGRAPEADLVSAKDSQIVFVPIYSPGDAEDKFVVIQENLKNYEVIEVKDRSFSEKYLALNVNEGFQASQGDVQEDKDTLMSF